MGTGHALLIQVACLIEVATMTSFTVHCHLKCLADVCKQKCKDCIENYHLWSFFYIVYTLYVYFYVDTTLKGSTFKESYIRNCLIITIL